MKPPRTHPPHALTRLLALLASLLLVGVAFATSTSATASASTNATLDAGWQQFTTEGGVGGASVAGPYLFESTKLTKVTVTDAYCHGDEFSVLDNGERIGDTSVIPTELNTCPTRFYSSDTARADASMADPTFGHGVFYVGPGSHSLEFVNKAIWNGTDSGSIAFFRLETAPLTMADCTVNGWGTFGTLFKNQGECVALSNSLRHLTAANVGTVGFEASPFGTIARGLTPPAPSWHMWTGGTFLQPDTYTTRRTVPITQADPGHEVLTVTVPVSLSTAAATDPSVVTVTMTMTPQAPFLPVPTGQYGSLGNTAWELVGDPTISHPSLVTTWSFRSTAPVTPGKTYDPIVISFDTGSSSLPGAVYNFAKPATASVSATAAGYATGTGSGWYLPQK